MPTRPFPIWNHGHSTGSKPGAAAGQLMQGGGYNYDCTSIRLRFDRRSTPIRLHFDRATTTPRPTSQP